MNGNGWFSDPSVAQNMYFDPFFQQQQYVAFGPDLNQKMPYDYSEGEVTPENNSSQHVIYQNHCAASNAFAAEYASSQPLSSSRSSAVRDIPFRSVHPTNTS